MKKQEPGLDIVDQMDRLVDARDQLIDAAKEWAEKSFCLSNPEVIQRYESRLVEAVSELLRAECACGCGERVIPVKDDPVVVRPVRRTDATAKEIVVER